jgi:methylamine---glutamate N-methyltransferase subunit C
MLLRTHRPRNSPASHFALAATTGLMKVLARACGHRHIQDFNTRDLTAWDRTMVGLAGVRFAGVGTFEAS